MSPFSWFSRSRTPLRPQRLVVIDLETSGLDTQNDRILSIGGVAVTLDGVAIDDAFEATVAQEAVSSYENVQIHGITHEQQRAGRALAQVIAEFERWRHDAPLLGWRVAFDHAFLVRAYKAHSIATETLETLCVQHLAGVLTRNKNASFEEVAQVLGLVVRARHHAAGDAWLTAQMFTLLAARARAEGVNSFHALRSLAKQSRWV